MRNPDVDVPKPFLSKSFLLFLPLPVDLQEAVGEEHGFAFRNGGA